MVGLSERLKSNPRMGRSRIAKESHNKNSHEYEYQTFGHTSVCPRASKKMSKSRSSSESEGKSEQVPLHLLFQQNSHACVD
jgi:hypothetical protein